MTTHNPDFTPAVVNVRVNKANDSWNVFPNDLPEHVKQHVWAYGIRQILNDACASAKDEDEAKAFVNKRWDNLVAGTLRAATGRESDPVRAEANRIALGKVKAGIKAKGIKFANVPKEKVAELVANFLAKNPGTMDTARENVERIKAMKDEGDALDGIDLSDLTGDADEAEDEAA